MTFATLVIAVFAQTPASIQQIHRVFVSGNNPAAQSVRAGLLRQGEYWVKKGKQPCLILVSKPSEADATLDVNQASYHGVVTGTLTLKSGELVWSDEYSGHNMRILVGEEIAMDAKMTGDRLLVKLEKEVGVCKKGYRKDSETAKSPSEQQASSQPSTESASQPANQTTSASPPANTAVHKPTQALQAGQIRDSSLVDSTS